MDLSKEGLCENPVDGYTSLQKPGNLGDDGDHGYSHVIRSPADVHRLEQNMAGTGASPDSGTNLMGEYDFPISSTETYPFAVCISKTMIFSNFCRGNMIEICIKSIQRNFKGIGPETSNFLLKQKRIFVSTFGLDRQISQCLTRRRSLPVESLQGFDII